MSCLAQVVIHSSQFPDQVHRDLLHSLRSRALNHKFLYDGLKQTRKWLALHQACAPSRTDPECAAVYDEAFKTAAAQLISAKVHLLGLGCGGGQKDTRCLRLLLESGKRVSYTPVDISTAMVLTARQCAMSAISDLACTPLVCDLATASDLPTTVETLAPGDAQRLFTFCGMIPNFEPGMILSRLAALLRPGDLLLLSANLAPGSDYAEGMRRILPFYDNQPTRDWLLSFLLDLGVEAADGNLVFDIEETEAGLKRVVARFHFRRPREIAVGCDTFHFCTSDALRVFFSYRHTPGLILKLLAQHRFDVRQHWSTSSEEEGVFVAQKGD